MYTRLFLLLLKLYDCASLRVSNDLKCVLYMHGNINIYVTNVGATVTDNLQELMYENDVLLMTSSHICSFSSSVALR